MSENTKIEWATHTFNPWEGCTKVSPGCTHCYAETRNHRFGLDNWGKGKPRRRTSAQNWKLPIQWNRGAQCQCGAAGKPPGECSFCSAGANRPRVFCASLADVFDEEVPIEWFADLMHLILRTPNLDWLLLTKRPENFLPRVLWANGHLASIGNIENPHTDPYLLTAYMLADWHNGKPPANVWMGTSVEDQKRADERIPKLLTIPAKVRFLSVEPLLDHVELYTDAQDPPNPETAPGIDWVIVGGESGPGARPCNVEWVRRIVKLCQFIPVPVFVKQLGSEPYEEVRENQFSTLSRRVIVKHSKGGDMSEWPEDLRVREFPTCKLGDV